MQPKERVGDLSDYFLKKLWEESQPENSQEMLETWTKLRDDLPRDLFRFCQLLNVAMTEKCHRRLCDEFFPKLDRNVSLDDLGWGDRLLFYPRASFKSTIANCFIAAMICVYPNCKVAIQSSKESLAKGFVDEVRHIFEAPENAEGNLILTRFQTIFPEHVVSERSQKASGTFTTPSRTKYSKEGTVDALSIEESKASIHYDLGRNDDVVSETNSGIGSSAEARAIVGRKLIESRNLFNNSLTLGTPQCETDGYVMLRESLGDELLFTSAPAWEVKPASAKKAEAELGEADYDLLFPYDRNGAARLTYRVLRNHKRSNNDSFLSQQLCISSLAKPKIEISQSMIDAHVMPESGLFAMNQSPTVSTWDLGYVANNRADFSVGVAGFRDDVRGAIVRDIQKGRWLKAELIQAMVSQAIQFRVQVIAIEGTNGSQWIEDDLIAALRQAGAVTTKVEFIPAGNVFDAKNLRFESVHSAIKSNELWFAIDSAQVPILTELTRARGKKYDDFTDSLARLLKKLQEPITVTPKEQPASPAMILLAEKKLRDLVYGQTDSQKERPEPEPAWGYRVEQLKPEPPPKEFDGYPVFTSQEAYLYQTRS